MLHTIYVPHCELDIENKNNALFIRSWLSIVYWAKDMYYVKCTQPSIPWLRRSNFYFLCHLKTTAVQLNWRETKTCLLLFYNTTACCYPPPGLWGVVLKKFGIKQFNQKATRHGRRIVNFMCLSEGQSIKIIHRRLWWHSNPRLSAFISTRLSSEPTWPK